MRLCVRADASAQIGTGHIMRCIALADELRIQGAEVSFVCREHAGHLIQLIEQKGYPVERLQNPDKEYSATSEDIAHAAWLGVSWEQDAAETIAALGKARPDWLIIDNYSIDSRWEDELRPHADKTMVIDDLADRLHDCDLLLDQNLYQAMETRYDNLVPDKCKRLLGPKYALLRPEFTVARKNLRQRDGQVRRVLVFFGGVDATNETLKTLLAIQHLNRPDLLIDVVIGAQNPHRGKLESMTSSLEGVTTHFQVTNMAELIARADLYVGAAGTTTWERCCLGLPSLVITVAANQVHATRYLDSLGVLAYLGESGTVDRERLSTAIEACMMSKQRLKAQSEDGQELVDGFGASRCADAIIHFPPER